MSRVLLHAAVFAALAGCAASVSGLKEDGTRSEVAINGDARPLAECFVRTLDEEEPAIFWQYRPVGTTDVDIYGKVDGGWYLALYEFRQAEPAKTRMIAWYPYGYDPAISQIHFDRALKWLARCP